jgi:pimeloyl-ACP methyl ester carboxylesterase
MPERYVEAFPFALASGPEQLVSVGEEAILSLPDLACSALRYPFCQAHVAILSGLADWLSPPWTHAARLAGVAPDSQLRLMPGLGHMLHHFAEAEIVELVEELTDTAP